MGNKKMGDFLNYIHTPMSNESIIILYSENDIIVEKCILYGDFVQSLLRLTFDTYMGDDITPYADQVKHFNWCWSKNLNNFKEEGLDFENSKLYDYFLQFIFEVFYGSTHKAKVKNLDGIILKLWGDIFNYGLSKTNSDVDTLIEVYRLFEKALKII